MGQKPFKAAFLHVTSEPIFQGRAHGYSFTRRSTSSTSEETLSALAFTWSRARWKARMPASLPPLHIAAYAVAYHDGKPRRTADIGAQPFEERSLRLDRPDLKRKAKAIDQAGQHRPEWDRVGRGQVRGHPQGHAEATEAGERPDHIIEKRYGGRFDRQVLDDSGQVDVEVGCQAAGEFFKAQVARHR